MELNKMTQQEALEQLLREYNNYQTYRKGQAKSYMYISSAEIAEFAKQLSKTNKEAVNKLVKTYLYQRLFLKQLRTYTINQRKLNTAYGKEDIHPSELNKDETKKEHQEQANKLKAAEDKQAAKYTKKVVNKIKQDLNK